MKKHTPWISTIRVFSPSAKELQAIMVMENKMVCTINASSLNFAAKCGNEIIFKLIKESRT